MKKVLMIGTGGTIASESTEAGLAPELSTRQLLHYIPGVADICEVDCLQVCNIDSTNILPHHWLDMAKALRENYDAYDGFVICHGTDTMAYTAAILSYLIQYSPKPIIITGGQKPIGSDNTDSKINLLDSFLCAASGALCGVQIVFNGKIILGTRARKTRSKSFQAFDSINYPYLGVVQDGRLLQYIRQPSREVPIFYEGLNPRIGLMKLIPGTPPQLLSWMLDHNDGVIIESYGVGGIPTVDGDDSFHQMIQAGIAQGKTVVVTTQVATEGSDLSIYQVGHDLKNKYSVLEAYDMTTEAVVAKLMWIRGITSDPDRIRELFYAPVNYDLLYLEGNSKS